MAKSKIVSNPEILGGKPVVAGTRISVELIMNFLSAGMSMGDILKEYPELKKSEVVAAIVYATKLVSQTRIGSTKGMRTSLVMHHEITR